MTEDQTRLRATTDGTPALPLLTDEQWAERQPRRRGVRPGRALRKPSLLVRLSHRAVLMTASATIGISAAVLVVHAYEKPPATEVSPVTALAESSPPSAVVVEPSEPREIPVRLAAQAVLPGASFAPVTIGSVRARPGIAELSLIVTTRRATRLLVILERRGTVLRQRSIRVRASGSHRIRLAELPPGALRWRIRVPGESEERGRATVAAKPVAPLSTSAITGSPTDPGSASPTEVTPPPATNPPRPASPAPAPKPQEPKKQKKPKGTGGTGGGIPEPRDPDTDGPGGGPVDPDDP